jgi:hypothetical protein
LFSTSTARLSIIFGGWSAADLSSRKPDLVENADGSVEVFFGPKKPIGATNWIKTNPARAGFHISASMLRTTSSRLARRDDVMSAFDP